jgi:hypothetical protein
MARKQKIQWKTQLGANNRHKRSNNDKKQIDEQLKKTSLTF